MNVHHIIRYETQTFSKTNNIQFPFFGNCQTVFWLTTTAKCSEIFLKRLRKSNPAYFYTSAHMAKHCLNCVCELHIVCFKKLQNTV